MNTPVNVFSTNLESLIRLGLIGLLLFWCFHIISPFIGVVTWGAIIAVAIYPFYQMLLDKSGGNSKIALTITSLIALAVVILPCYALLTSLIDGASSLGGALKSGSLSLPAPAESVRSWPLVGENIFDLWSKASADLAGLVASYHDQLVGFGHKLLGIAAGAGMGLMQVLLSLLIAIAFLARAETSSQAVARLAVRLSNAEQGEHFVKLSVATIRSVANGLLGIAILQGIMAGVGMELVHVPAAGFLAFLVLVLAIAQIPQIILLGPIAIYVFSVQEPLVATLFAIWALLTSFADALLKPLLLGRGVDAPMLVILLGAIGGMIVSGIIGLFIGAVILALGYNLFQAWLNQGSDLNAAE